MEKIIENIVKIPTFEDTGNSLLVYAKKLITLESIIIMTLIVKMKKSTSLLVNLNGKLLITI
jgi:hypothetical protein